MKLPTDFQDKMKRLLKEDYLNYQKSFENNIGQTFRANQLKTEPADLFRRFHNATGQTMTRTIPWCKQGAYYLGEERLSLHPFYQAGLYYLQEPSAMAPAAYLPVEPGERVLDLCAAPGGKTTALGARLQGEGILVANDISISRCRALLKNVEMAGIPNAIITCEAPEKLAAHFPGYFDKILIDAPCSGEGMFRRDPAMVRSWSPEEVVRYSLLQKSILACAAAMLRPGGCLLYSTCTYSPEENEQVIETLLEQERFSMVPLPLYQGVDEGHPEWSLSGNPSLSFCRRFWNHRVEGEGQFAALLRKKDHSILADEGHTDEEHADRGIDQGYHKKTVPSGKRGKKKSRVDQKEKSNASIYPEEFLEFMKQVSQGNYIHLSEEEKKSRLFMAGERIFLLPAQAPDMRGLRVVSSGLHLGNCRKKRFEPGQALAMALSPQQFDNILRLELSDDRVERYLRCETINLKEEEDVRDGWILVCVEEYPLGWGKAMRGQIRNKYPAGWRRQ